MDPLDAKEINWFYKQCRLNTTHTNSSGDFDFDYNDPPIENIEDPCVYCYQKPFLFLYKNEKVCKTCLLEETNKLLKK